MNFDAWNEVTNGEETYNEISAFLGSGNGPVLIGWTDEESSHLDVMFSIVNIKVGNIQGIHPAAPIVGGMLFVTIMRIGAFAFAIHDGPLSSDYVGEKLGTGENNPTTDALTKLINEIISGLAVRNKAVA